MNLCHVRLGLSLLLTSSTSLAQSGWFWQNPLPEGNPLYAVSVLSSDNVIAVGAFGTILRTRGGGATWTPQTSGTDRWLLGVSFVNGNTGTVVGENGMILRTTDGGATWTRQTSGTQESLYAVSFVDANSGTAVGSNGAILRTTDGGATWRSQTSGTGIDSSDERRVGKESRSGWWPYH